jgi:hypothetical protein
LNIKNSNLQSKPLKDLSFLYICLSDEDHQIENWVRAKANPQNAIQQTLTVNTGNR